MAKRIAPLKIGRYTFDHASYDVKGDVLYLAIGPPRAAATGEETPEGHVIRYDADNNVVGLTVINAKWYLDRDGALKLTLPAQFEIAPEAVEELLAASA